MPPENNSYDPGATPPAENTAPATGTAAAPLPPQTTQSAQPASNYYDPLSAAPNPMASPTGAPAYAAPQSPYGYPGTAYNPVGGKSKKGLYIGLGIAGAVVVLIAASVFAYTLATRITAQDIAGARDNITSINDDINDVTDALDAMESADNSQEFDEHAATVASKLSHAETEYKALKGSAVLHNRDVAEKFKAIDAKWDKYIAYARNNAADLKTLSPILLKLTTDSEALTANTPTTTAALKTYLSDYKKILDETSGKIGAVKMTLSDNQKIVDSFKTFLDDSSAATARAQKDLESSNTAALYADLGAISDAQSELNSDITDAQANIRDYEDRIDPYDDFSHMLTALSRLQYDMGA